MPLALRLTKVAEDDLHLKGVELLTGFDVLGGKEVSHKVGIGMNLAGEEAARNFFVVVSEIDFRKVLFEFETLHDV